MTVPFTDKEVEHLKKFIGYGELNADVWFLGMEEAGGGEKNLRDRLTFHQIEDCAEAHKKLDIMHLHWGKRTIQRTWRGMCYVMLALARQSTDRESIRAYQAEKLGRYGGNTLLTELMPIPSPKLDQWRYEELLPQFKSRQDYFAQVKPYRLALLRELIETNSPSAIVAHGKGYWSEYKALFSHLQFVKHNTFEVAKSDSTVVILTGQFASRSMNGKFDEVAQIISEHLNS